MNTSPTVRRARVGPKNEIRSAVRRSRSSVVVTKFGSMMIPPDGPTSAARLGYGDMGYAIRKGRPPTGLDCGSYPFCVRLRTKRWSDPVEPDDGFRLLICRIRPRGVSKQKQTWNDWWPDLGPSRALLDAFHGKQGPAIAWDTYTARYLDEMGG